jgi:hypothetical protein
MTQQYIRNVVQIEILSNEPWAGAELENLEVISYEITEGHSSGLVTILHHNEELSAEEMERALLAQGSSPEFLVDRNEDEDDDLEVAT